MGGGERARPTGLLAAHYEVGVMLRHRQRRIRL